MGYCLKFWRAQEGDKRFNPFARAFPDMPSETFATRQEAVSAAEAFLAKYKSKGGESDAGYDQQDDLYWIREEVALDRFRFTEFEIVTSS